MEKLEVKFVLNYGRDKRDINIIKTEFEDSIYDFHTCFSFKILFDGEEIPPSKILKLKLSNIREKKYFFKARRFNCSNLKKGDYGILKETFNKVTRYYLVKIIEVDDFIKYKNLSDKTIAEYINSNIMDKTNYVAKFISFYTDKNYLLNNNNFISSDISFEDFREKYKNTSNTLFQPKEKIIIEWDNK